MKDAQILELFFQRSQQAVEAVGTEYGNKLRRLAENILGSWQDAEECVNDALMAAWEAIPPARPEPLLPWLYTVTRHKAMNRLRHDGAKKRASSMTVALEELGEVAGADAPAREAETAELTRAIDRFLGKLGKTDRQLMVGRYWYGEAYDTMALRLGLTENACMARVARARKKLKTALEKEGLL